MKARMLKIIGLLTVGFMVTAASETVGATTTAGISAGISKSIAATSENSSSVNAGVSSALAACIDVSTARATISEGENIHTTTGQTETICGYTNLGIANVEGNLNVREAAGEDAELVGKMPGDAGCEILGTEGDWTKVRSGEVEGFVKSEFLMTGEEAKAYAPQVMSTIATCTTTTLRVRQEPNTECEILALMPEGEEVEVIENLGDWIKVSVDNEEGYVSADYVTVSDELRKAMTMTEVKYGEGVSDVRVDLVSYACQFVGNPYVWGGTSLTRGADCSGFTLSIFAKYGIYLPHSSAAQANYGRRISAGEAQPGDLFFYGSGRRISHVAIYIGNGQIVHASSARTGIKISSAYYRTPICVTRLFD
ncbi:MAG: C40 family peptidase [Lachnospiraceae bacterium]|nr:C40 family peptidase [Lachnospiraceae bacterium]